MTHFYSGYISKLFNTDLHLFESGVWLEAFGQALISVFIPILLWDVGLGIREIIIFYIIFNAFDVPLNLVAAKMIQKFGARLTMILATFAQLTYFILLYNLKDSWTMIAALALFMAIYDSFYWVAHLYIFSSAAHKTGMLRNDVSTLKNVRILGMLVAPMIGAAILGAAGPSALIGFSALVMVASLIPLFRMRHLKFIPEKKTASFMKFFEKGSEKANYLFTSLDAVRQEAEDVIWPFFLFFTFKNLQTVAFAPVLMALVELIIITKVGRISYKRSIYKLISMGALGALCIWVARWFFFGNEFFAVASVAVITFLVIMIDVPLEVSIFHRAHETEELAAVTYLNLFRMLARGLLYVGLYIFGTYFWGAFYVVPVLLLILSISARMLKLNNKTT